MTNVLVLIGAGQIGQAVTRRVGIGRHILLADMLPDNANAAAEVLGNAGYELSQCVTPTSGLCTRTLQPRCNPEAIVRR